MSKSLLGAFQGGSAALLCVTYWCVTYWLNLNVVVLAATMAAHDS
jgi:hypothetical protein